MDRSATTAQARRRITFELENDTAQAVFVAGTFNNWAPAAKPLRKGSGNGRHRVTLMLPRGRHEYKFVVDGAWCTDPQNPASVPNGLGSQNSVLVVE